MSALANTPTKTSRPTLVTTAATQLTAVSGPAVHHFADYRLRIGGLVAQPMELSLDDLKSCSPTSRSPSTFASRAGNGADGGSISAIEFVADFTDIGSGFGGYNQDHGFFGYRQPV